MPTMKHVRSSQPYRFLAISGALLLLAVVLGAGIAAASAVPMAVWVRNLVAWAIGAVAALALARAPAAWAFPAMLASAALPLALTLLDAGQLGVHRWVRLGPISFNVAMLMLPAAVVATAALAAKAPWFWLLALACLAILAIQPDASQATALAAALALIALTGAAPPLVRWAVPLGAVILAGVAWWRPDPLQPVPEVEEILLLAWAISPVLAAAGLASLGLFSLAPGWFGQRGSPDLRTAAFALSLYLLVSAAMPFFGAFPAPYLGMGVSPIFGAWLGLGSLAMLARARNAEARGSASSPAD